jgi:tRNA (mo5U34)-methyltransferase
VTSVGRALTNSELRDEVVRLGPWHIEIDITPEVSTAASLEASPGTYSDDAFKMSFHNPRDGFLRRLYRAFPSGLEGRSVLDCACNCGAYLFYAKEAGAGRCLGFDVRDHWISQARFLAEHRERPSDQMRFEVSDLYDLHELEPGTFDLTLFMGIFYHLPDPIRGLKLAADLTEEVLIVNTATKAGQPDGYLVAEKESSTRMMSGTYGLAWLPTGPEVLTRILNWLGFPEVRCSVWRHAPRQRADLDRLEVIAARTPGFFAQYDRAVASDTTDLAELLSTRTRPLSKVAVAGEPDVGEVPHRDVTAVEIPIGPDGVEVMERLTAQGVTYLALVGQALEALVADRATADWLQARSPRIFEDATCHLYGLEG